MTLVSCASSAALARRARLGVRYARSAAEASDAGDDSPRSNRYRKKCIESKTPFSTFSTSSGGLKCQDVVFTFTSIVRVTQILHSLKKRTNKMKFLCKNIFAENALIKLLWYFFL